MPTVENRARYHLKAFRTASNPQARGRDHPLLLDEPQTGMVRQANERSKIAGCIARSREWPIFRSKSQVFGIALSELCLPSDQCVPDGPIESLS